MDVVKTIKLLRFYGRHKDKLSAYMFLGVEEFYDAINTAVFYLRLEQKDELYRLCSCCKVPKLLSEFRLTPDRKPKCICTPCSDSASNNYRLENMDKVKSNYRLRRDVAKNKLKNNK